MLPYCNPCMYVYVTLFACTHMLFMHAYISRLSGTDICIYMYLCIHIYFIGFFFFFVVNRMWGLGFRGVLLLSVTLWSSCWIGLIILWWLHLSLTFLVVIKEDLQFEFKWHVHRHLTSVWQSYQHWNRLDPKLLFEPEFE